MGATTWRLKATEGAGWVEHVHPDGRPAITANARQARQYDSLDRALADAARLRPSVIPVRPVAGPAFSRHVHGEPGPQGEVRPRARARQRF